MYWFGQTITTENWLEEKFWQEVPARKKALARTPVNHMLELLDAFGKSLSWDEGVVERLSSESGFTLKETRETLSLLPGLLSKESLEKRLRGEFGRLSVLDQFSKLPHQTALVKAVPLGVVLHVTAGNVFLSSIDSLLMGLLTKNISLLKVSSQNTFFPFLFAEKVLHFDQQKILADKFAVVHWKGGDLTTETALKKRVNAIIAWGGEEMIEAYRKDLPSQVKFLDFGPKISLQVITRKGLQNKDLASVAKSITQDIAPWNQGACASPQNLYVEEGIDTGKLLSALEEAFAALPLRSPVTEDEATEILKEKYRGYYSLLMEGGDLRSGATYLLHEEKNKFVKPSPLNRSLIIKSFKDADDLSRHLEPFSAYLQSCSYLLSEDEREEYLTTLSLTGIKRLAPLGTIMQGMEGAPHDGRFVLRELVNFVGDERRIGPQDSEVLTSSADLKKNFNELAHPEGYIFSSGGTTGEPKFVHFSYQEFDYITDMLAFNLSAQGIKSGMTVANLFVAGNLWSSFMAVEKALEKIGAIQLPIGGLCQTENILLYLRKFTPDVVMGIPSLLVATAEASPDLSIPYLFYAGEGLSEMRRDFLTETWKVKTFGSAGYASVDAGVIGYQCAHSAPGEHHVFSDLVELKIIEGEGVVTSLYRDTLPIKNYRTGDRMEWIPDCACGRKDPRFKLLGRIDNVIQIWSCRLLVEDIERAFQTAGVHTFQVIIRETREHNLTREKLDLWYESDEELSGDQLLAHLYDLSRDLRDTLSLEAFRKDVNLKNVKSIPRNARTGKISVVLDQRR